MSMFLLLLLWSPARGLPVEPDGSDSTVLDPRIVSQFHAEAGFSEEEGPQFNNLVLDMTMGRLYIGAVNRLYQLDQDLELLMETVTGPHPDSPHCFAKLSCPSGVNREMSNNVNKALLIDYGDSRLIDCGSIFQGLCTVRSLNNISVVEAEIMEPVVANNPTASTVAFISPGTPNYMKQVMYVGVTYTGEGPYRSEVPAVASRSLDSGSFFQIAQTTETTGTRMFVNSLARERYPINYIHGFNSEGFSYFLTTQMMETRPSPYHSRLVRVCDEDSAYNSYTEIPIQCVSQDLNYTLVQAAYVGKPGSDLAAELGITPQDDVLFGVFSTPDQSEGELTSKPSQQSALCVYSLKSIRSMFTNNIQKCMSGEGMRGLDFISPSTRCINTKLTIGEEFCGLDVNNPLGGKLPVTATPVVTFPTLLTAVTATSTSEFTVAFLGTGDGRLRKVAVESPIGGSEYADIEIASGSSVRSKLLLDLKRDHIYVMTDNALSKVKVHECEQYTDGNQCLEAQDPYCGWCSLGNKCSLREECQDAGLSPLNWISYKSFRSTRITSVSHSNSYSYHIQITQARTLNLEIDNLPDISGNYYCAFSFTALGQVLVNAARRTNKGVSCTTPRTSHIPEIPYGETHIISKLSVRGESGPDFATTNFTFFDCNSHSSCTTCVSSLFPCDWCVYGNQCTHDKNENCRNDLFVSGINSIAPGRRTGPDFCPRITAAPGLSNEVLVSSGLQKSIRVQMDHIPYLFLQSRFVCQFNIEGRVSSVNAEIMDDTIICDEMDFTYTSRGPNITATFKVIIMGRDGMKLLDNPDNIHVVIYRCEDMADNCEMCHNLNEKYQCGWCRETETCEVKAQCGSDDHLSWIGRDDTC